MTHHPSTLTTDSPETPSHDVIRDFERGLRAPVAIGFILVAHDTCKHIANRIEYAQTTKELIDYNEKAQSGETEHPIKIRDTIIIDGVTHPSSAYALKSYDEIKTLKIEHLNALDREDAQYQMNCGTTLGMLTTAAFVLSMGFALARHYTGRKAKHTTSPTSNLSL